MRQNDPVFGATHDRVAIAAALGLSVDDLDPQHAPQTVSTGMPFCTIVPLRSLEVSQRLQIAQRDAQRYLDNSDAKFFYGIAPAAATRDDAAGLPHWHARMQFYGGVKIPRRVLCVRLLHFVAGASRPCAVRDADRHRAGN